MKRFVIPFLAIALLAVSCGPSRHAMNVEMRYPSKSGLDLSGKILAVVYLENDNPSSNLFNQGMADGFAYALERDYGTGEGSIGVYKMRSQEGAKYASRDSLINLLVDTGSDVVFLFDTLQLGTMTIGGASKVASAASVDSSYLNVGDVQFSMALYAFDAMDQTEKVHTFNGTSTANPYAYSNGTLSSSELFKRAQAGMLDEGWQAGRQVAMSFESEWRHEQYSLTYFENEKWYRALDRAEAYDWKGAMDLWMTFLSTNDLLRRSCAAYNIATACYMLGEYDLALEWLDLSDKDNKLPYSDGLRKRITERRAL